MIIKNSDLKTVIDKKFKIFLFYGSNTGLLEETINSFFKANFNDNIFIYNENDLINDIDKFKLHIFNKSFFNEKKLLIIDRISDSALPYLRDLFDKEFDDVVIILKAGILEKKSKLRSFFEKHKAVIVAPFYEDNHQTLSIIILNYFKKKSIKISTEIVNLIIERSGGNRIILNGELEKISSFVAKNKLANSKNILKLIKPTENVVITDLSDHIISKNKKSLNIINNVLFNFEDKIILVRLLLYKLKRIKKIKIILLKNNNIDQALSSIKPPIFWKEKEILKHQLNNLSLAKTSSLIKSVSNLELQIKKNSEISGQIINNFIFERLLQN